MAVIDCPARKAAGTTKPKGAGYCGALRGDGATSRKAQTRAAHNFQCVTVKEVPQSRWGVTTLVKVGPRNTTVMQAALAGLVNKFNN